MKILDRCCCFELETGGLILAWFGLIGNGILAIINLIILIANISVPCHLLQDNTYFIELAKDLHIDDCDIAKKFSLVVTAILFVFHSIDFVVNVYFYIGLKKILPNAITELIATFFFVIREIIKLSILGFVNIAIFGSLSVYFFIVIISIYYRFKGEASNNQGYQRPKGDSER